MLRGSVPILMYHLVSPRPVPAYRKYTVTPEVFATQMRWLKRAGYQCIDIDGLLDHPNGLPARAVVITFDDGYEECLEHAVPAMQKHGFTAHFYLIAGLMGKTSNWLLKEKGVEFPLFGWREARRLEEMGFHCGAHSMSHPRLVELDDEGCRRELVDARRLLEYELGHEVRHLAYPYGSLNSAVRDLAAEAGYRSACSVQIGHVTPGFDPLALRRVPVTGQDSLIDFVWRLQTGWPVGEWLRGKASAIARRLGNQGGPQARAN